MVIFLGGSCEGDLETLIVFVFFESHLLWKRYKSLNVFIHVFVRGREKYSVFHLNNKNIQHIFFLEIQTLVV